MNIVEFEGSYYVYFKYSKRLVDAIKRIPGRWWHQTQKCWVVPKTSEDALRNFSKQYGFRWSEAQHQEKEQNYTLPSMPELQAEIPLKRQLFHYQGQGVAYTLDKQRLIIGDEPGLGKTGQAIAALVASGATPALVICPASLKMNWEREISLWSNLRARILDAQTAKYMHRFIEAGMVDVFIINYESLKKYFVSNIIGSGKKWRLKDVIFNPRKDFFKTVIIDESHRCKDFSTQQTKIVKGICAGKQWIMALTGTPVVNKPKDLMPQLGIIGRLEDFGGYKYFNTRYCLGGSGASNLKELNYKLNTTCFYRRNKSDVLKDLPAKMRQVMLCEIDETHRLEYARAEDDLRQYLIKYKNADDEKVERALRGEVMVRIGLLKNISARGKLADVKEFINDTIDSGQKLVVFLHLKEVFNRLKAMFPGAVSIVGENTTDERQAAVDAFQNNPECKLILCSLKAASVGLTLTAASRVAFIELGWHPAEMEQAEDRCHRIGQKDSVQCTYFLGRNTIDEWVYKIIDDKRKVTSEITGANNDVEVDVVEKFATLFNVTNELKETHAE
ncbi:MAG TPA: DEAD/DEAH box helicase [Chitinophagales bacterium]|nr:DEAD/DEAH box helicase [Chitinophagales bacterium]